MADFRKSNLKVGAKKTDILTSEVIHSARHPHPEAVSALDGLDDTDNFGNEDEFNNIDEGHTSAVHHHRGATK